MSVQYSGAVRIAMLDAIEVGAVGGNGGMGTNPKLRLYSGTKPAYPATAWNVAPTDQIMCLEMALPANWLDGATDVGNVVSKAKSSGAWSGQAGAASGAGGISFYRIYDSAGAVCHEQGTVTATGGGGDMTIDSVTVAINQTVTVTSKVTTAGNA